MPDRLVSGFDCGDGNRSKCQRHGLSIDDIESLFVQPVVALPDHGHGKGEAGLRSIAKTAPERHVFAVLTIRSCGGENLIRPIGARCMHRKEVERDEKDNPALSKR
jgi:uncharacterized DUF497 family protein